MKLKFIASISLVWAMSFNSFAQTLKLEDALSRSVEQYDKIKRLSKKIASFLLSCSVDRGNINFQIFKFRLISLIFINW